VGLGEAVEIDGFAAALGDADHLALSFVRLMRTIFAMER
jgi:hypothetical protein